MSMRPSSLPMLAQCPSFESGGTSDFRDMGTDRHSALKGYLAEDLAEFDLLDEESQHAIKWAGEYIRLHAPMSDYPLKVEETINIDYPDFSETKGAPDVICGPELLDFKWRRRDYTAQMAAYALPMLDHHDRVRVHVLYGAECRAETFFLDREAAEKIVNDVLAGLGGPPRPCDYCGWCSRQLMCPALTGRAKAIALGYSDMVELPNWHPSEMDQPEHLALALLLWRKVLKKWGESVEFHAMEAMTKKGLKLPGCELVTARGKKFVADTKAAYEASGLPAEKFLQGCGVRLNTYKTSKLPGLDSIAKEHFGEASLAAAKRNLMRKLGDVVQTGADTLKIKITGEDNSETES